MSRPPGKTKAEKEAAIDEAIMAVARRRLGNLAVSPEEVEAEEADEFIWPISRESEAEHRAIFRYLERDLTALDYVYVGPANSWTLASYSILYMGETYQDEAGRTHVTIEALFDALHRVRKGRIARKGETYTTWYLRWTKERREAGYGNESR